MLLAPFVIVVGTALDLHEIFAKCISAHSGEADVIADAVLGNDFDPSRSGPLSFFLAGAPDSAFDAVPGVAAAALGVHSSDMAMFRVNELRGTDRALQLKRGMYEHLRARHGRRTIFVVEGVESLRGAATGALNAFLSPMNRDKPIIQPDASLEKMYPSDERVFEAQDCRSCVFFFMHALTAVEYEDLRAGVGSAGDSNEVVKAFVDRRFLYDRESFTPEALSGRLTRGILFGSLGPDQRQSIAAGLVDPECRPTDARYGGGVGTMVGIAAAAIAVASVLLSGREDASGRGPGNRSRRAPKRTKASAQRKRKGTARFRKGSDADHSYEEEEAEAYDDGLSDDDVKMAAAAALESSSSGSSENSSSSANESEIAAKNSRRLRSRRRK
jgi:hypothetical protein